MMIRILLLLLACGLSGQDANPEFNTPAEVRLFLNENQGLAKYEISTRINPFYLRGDFDGDKSVDFAVLVVERKSKQRGVVVIHPKKKAFFVVGAGQDFFRSDGYNHKDFSFKAWRVYQKRRVAQSLEEETSPPTLLGEAILVEWPEAASGIIYWTGKKYQWYQLGG